MWDVGRCVAPACEVGSVIMKRFFLFSFAVLLLGGMAAAGAGVWLLHRYGQDLPDYRQLAAYEPPTTTRVHAADGRLVATYAAQNRLFVPIAVVPDIVIRAFLAAEDKNFYSHPGLDVMGLTRAAVKNAIGIIEGRRPVGGSTITQQVAKNFLLTNEVSITRKIKEALLAFRIERAFDKDHILELYLNEIYLGAGSYGIAAASLNYFNKSLDDLTVAEAAFLAALPKAPNNYHPVRFPAAAKGRRDWVLSRMQQDGFLTPAEAAAAKEEPIEIRRRGDTELFAATWYAEDVRRELVARLGEKAVYEGGLSVRASVDPRLQALTDSALREGLREYDERHGWRGPIAKIDPKGDAAEALRQVDDPPALSPFRLAVVTRVGTTEAEIALKDGAGGKIRFAEMRWARPYLDDGRTGAAPRRPADVVSVGDVVPVERMSSETGPFYRLRQIPAVDGAVVAIDPHTGRVLAMSGGYATDRSQFNRASQAWRQPGSAFKPFVYLAALEDGYTPATLVLDAPIVIDQGAGLGKWKPANFTHEFYGAVPMRVGLEKSRNLMTVRLADHVGMAKIANLSAKFGISENMPHVLSMALGAGETTLLRLTAAYAMIANGGRRIVPTLVDRVQDRHGRTVYRHDQRDCPQCSGSEASSFLPVPMVPDTREQLDDPASNYQMISMLQGVVQHGTGRRVVIDGVPVAGKTGTTDEVRDAWFVGFTSNLVVGVFVGFDQPRSLGAREQAATTAAPIFKRVMDKAIDIVPAGPFRVPPGIRFVRVSHDTGLPPVPGDPNVIMEAFKPGTEPTTLGPVVGGGLGGPSSGARIPDALPERSGIGGLY